MRMVSPIKAKPLHQAGESLRHKLFDLVFDEFLTLSVLTAFLWVMAITEWFRYLQIAEPNPVLYTFMAAAFSAYAGVRGYFAYRKLQNFQLGLEGERTVGEYLDRLVAKGYRVYHDIPGEQGNIDHVIISARGVFTIETKTRSKPERGEAVVTFDGETISFNGLPPDAAPIRQARAQAAYLKTLLKDEAGNDYPVKPVVVIPGWFVERLPGAKQSGVWVLNPKALHKWIDHGPETMPADRIKLAAGKLGRFIRSR